MTKPRTTRTLRPGTPRSPPPCRRHNHRTTTGTEPQKTRPTGHRTGVQRSQVLSTWTRTPRFGIPPNREAQQPPPLEVGWSCRHPRPQRHLRRAGLRSRGHRPPNQRHRRDPHRATQPSHKRHRSPPAHQAWDQHHTTLAKGNRHQEPLPPKAAIAPKSSLALNISRCCWCTLIDTRKH
jgi:hypothetical protein